MKIDEWLAAGVPEVWVVMPANQTLTIQTASGDVIRLTADQTLAGRDILSGFTCQIGDLFPDWS